MLERLIKDEQYYRKLALDYEDIDNDLARNSADFCRRMADLKMHKIKELDCYEQSNSNE